MTGDECAGGTDRPHPTTTILVSSLPGARLTKPWLLTISLDCIEMNRRLLVNNDFILHSLLGKLMISLITRA